MRRWLVLSAGLLAVVSGCGGGGDASSPTQAALQELRSGNYDGAISTAGDAIKREPNDPANYLYRGKAYHYRNAAGDAERAVADFSEAIRLSPKSSDAFYSRSLVHRDQGRAELAKADEDIARELDGQVHDAYKKLPDMITPAEVAKAAPEPKQEEKLGAGDAKQKESERETFEKLKKRYEPGFGSIRSLKRNEAARTKEDLQDARKERYRELMKQPSYTLSKERGPDEEESDVLGGVDVRNPTADDAAAGASQAAEGAAGGATQRNARTAAPTAQQRTRQAAASAAAQPFTPPPVRSPFPQRAPAPTGYLQPSNPFGGQPRATTGGSTVSSPFNSGPVYSPYSNPAVRPTNPRQYLP